MQFSTLAFGTNIRAHFCTTGTFTPSAAVFVINIPIVILLACRTTVGQVAIAVTNIRSFRAMHSTFRLSKSKHFACWRQAGGITAGPRRPIRIRATVE